MSDTRWLDNIYPRFRFWIIFDISVFLCFSGLWSAWIIKRIYEVTKRNDDYVTLHVGRSVLIIESNIYILFYIEQQAFKLHNMKMKYMSILFLDKFNK